MQKFNIELIKPKPAKTKKIPNLSDIKMQVLGLYILSGGPIRCRDMVLTPVSRQKLSSNVITCKRYVLPTVRAHAARVRVTDVTTDAHTSRARVTWRGAWIPRVIRRLFETLTARIREFGG